MCTRGAREELNSETGMVLFDCFKKGEDLKLSMFFAYIDM